MSSNTQFANVAPGAVGVDRNHPAEQNYRLEIVDADAGVVRVLGVPRKKIAICGFAASSRMLAPFDDPTWEIWGLNQLYRHIPRATRWFDIHANWREDNVEGTDHPGWLRECGMPIYMSTREPSIPTSVNYPLKAAMDRVVGTDYFTSTVAFMLAYAILQIDEQVDADIEALVTRAHADVVPDTYGANDRDEAQKILLGASTFRRWLSDRYAEREIGIFGIDLIVGTEYDFQKACVEYILGLAHARGITVRLPEQTALLKQRWRYGYETEPKAHPIKLNELVRRQNALVGERNKLIAQLQTLDGALQENGYWSQVADLRLKGGTVKLNESDT